MEMCSRHVSPKDPTLRSISLSRPVRTRSAVDTSPGWQLTPEGKSDSRTGATLTTSQVKMAAAILNRVRRRPGSGPEKQHLRPELLQSREGAGQSCGGGAELGVGGAELGRGGVSCREVQR